MNPFHYPIYSDDDELHFPIPSAIDDYSLPIQHTAAPSEEHNNHQILCDPMMAVMDAHVVPRTNQKGKKQQQRKQEFATTTWGTTRDCNQMENENRKWKHKEVEKQRRQEMAILFTTFRSLLPIEYIKGKRSTCDHMHEGVNYIKQLKNKVQQLQEKRDGLLKLSNLSHVIPTYVIVEPFSEGIQIKCSYNLRNHAFPLSRVLDIVIKEGLNLVNCTSTKTNDTLIHTIRSEDPYMRTDTDYTELQTKLAQAIASSSSN